MTNRPKRIQMTRQRPWRQDHPDAVIVARPSKWGSPFRVGDYLCPSDHGVFTARLIVTQGFAVAAFREMLAQPDRDYPSDEEIRAELRGRDLACWCPLDAACHGDVLLEIANAAEEAK